MIAEVITLMMHQDLGVKDNTDLMRCHILGLELERTPHTVESAKQTSAYLGCHYDVRFNDEYLQKLIDKVEELRK